MYNSATRYAEECPCVSNRRTRICNAQEDNVQLIHEPPVRDNPRKLDNVNSSCSGQFLPPGPPNGDYDQWDLQFCKWWGWTWVKKGDKETIQQPTKVYDYNYSPVSPVSPVRPMVPQTASVKQVHIAPTESNFVRPNSKKKSRGLFCCLRKKNVRRPASPLRPPVQQTNVAIQPSRTDTFETAVAVRRPSEPDVQDCCCCCCCCGDAQYQCNQMCCSCMCHNQICCCCACPESPPQKNSCRSTETQTQRHVKEQATKMSNVHVPPYPPQQQHTPLPPKRKQVCRCKCTQRRPCVRVCCPCMTNTCPCMCNTCPCLQNSSSNNNEQKRLLQDNNNEEDVGKSETRSDNDQIINYCLTRNVYKPKANDFFKFSGSNFTTLHKSLDILLKNNINIMNLFADNNDTKVFKKEEKTANVLGDNSSTISITECLKKTDHEHSKLLTAVCDAILSSHKFDNEKYNPLKLTSSKSTEKSTCDSKDSRNSLSILQNQGGILGKIFNDLNFPLWSYRNRSNDEVNLQREIGIQVHNTPTVTFSKKYRPYPMDKFGRLTRNKSKTLVSTRLSKRLDALRRIDALKSGNNEVKTLKRELRRLNITDKVNSDENKKPKISLTNIFKSSDESISNTLSLQQKLDFAPSSVTAPPQGTSRFQTIEDILSSNHVNSKSPLRGTIERSAENQNGYIHDGYSPLFQERKDDTNLLEITSPPFTDYDLPLSFEYRKKENSINREK